MIQKQRCLFYFVGAEAFKSLEEAQKCDLLKLMPSIAVNPTNDQFADWLLANKVAVTDILTTTPTSRLKARKLHGGGRKKKVKVNVAKLVEDVCMPDVTP